MSSKRVLIVDDEEAIRVLLQRGFEYMAAEYAVTTATDGREALSEIWQQPFNLVVVDYNMPGLNGLELAQVIREAQPEAFILLITGSYVPLVKEAVESVKIDACLEKPFGLSQFLAVVKQVEALQAVV